MPPPTLDRSTNMNSHAHPSKRRAAAPPRRDAGRERPTRRLTRLAALVGAAAIVVLAAVVISGGGDHASSRPAIAQRAAGPIPGQRESAAMLAGIPQQGIHLGRADAPVRVVEFADLQC